MPIPIYIAFFKCFHVLNKGNHWCVEPDCALRHVFFPKSVFSCLGCVYYYLYNVLWKGLPIVSNIPFLNPLEEFLRRLLPTRASTSMLVSTLITWHGLSLLVSQENLRNIVSLPLGDGFKGCFLMLTPIWGRCPIGRILFVQVDSSR